MPSLPSPMLRLAGDNSLLSGDGKPVVLKGAGLGGIQSRALASNNCSRMDEHGKLHYRLSVA